MLNYSCCFSTTTKLSLLLDQITFPLSPALSLPDGFVFAIYNVVQDHLFPGDFPEGHVWIQCLCLYLRGRQSSSHSVCSLVFWPVFLTEVFLSVVSQPRTWFHSWSVNTVGLRTHLLASRVGTVSSTSSVMITDPQKIFIQVFIIVS